jgi:iron complex outermembrane receptor protein
MEQTRNDKGERDMKTVKLLGASAIAMALAAPAIAQDNSASDVTGGYDDNEIVVTAQRQSESLQEVPIAVSAFNAEALEKQQIENSSDLMLTLPNITFTKTSFTSSSFTIRGVGDLCVGVSCDQATGVHINNSPTPSTRLFETEFFDLERVEVLRGPQGTLFGRNATSGVLNLVTAKPRLGAFAAAGEAEYGNFEAIKVKGMVNVPIGDTLAVRAAGFYLKRDGYTKNLFDGKRLDDRNMFAVRGSLRWEPTENTTIDLMGYYFKEDDNRLRIQKQLCHRDPTGVLGCLPDYRAYEYPNANSQLSSTLPSVQLLRAQGGATLGAAFGPLGLVSLTGADVLAGQINPANNRVINTPFVPTYLAKEQQYQATLEHNFDTVTFELQGLYAKSAVDSRQDPAQNVPNRAIYAAGLARLQTYATTGIPGIAGSAAYFAPAAAALIPNGATGVLCTTVPDESNTGVFGGHSQCGLEAISNDRSSLSTRTISLESLFTTNFDGPINFLAGATYVDNKISENHYTLNSFGLDYAGAMLGALTSLGRTLSGTPTPPSYQGPTIFDSYTPDFRLKSYGVFGEAYFEPSEAIKLTLGLRYNNDKKSLRARNQLLNFLVPYGTTDAFASPYAAGFDADNLTPCTPTGTAVAGKYGSVPGCDAFQLRDAGFDSFTGRAVLDFKVSEDNLLYASYSRGYKSGGINPPLAVSLGGLQTTFKPEFVNAFEIGTKNKFGDGALTLNGSAFYYQYKGMQLSRIVNRTSINDNVDADIYGVEAEAILRPSRQMTINLGASYLKTKVTGDLLVQNPRDPSAGRDDVVILKDLSAAFNCVVAPSTAGNGAAARQLVTAFNGALGLPGPGAFPSESGIAATGAFSLCGSLASTIANPSAALRGLFGTPTGALPFSVTNVGLVQNIKGKELPQAPNFKWNVGVQYDLELPGGTSLVPRVDLIYIGDSYGNIFNGTINHIKGYAQINGQMQYNSADERWYARAFVQNLTDSSPITGLAVNDQSQGVGTNIFTLEPRRYGIAVGLKF